MFRPSLLGRQLDRYGREDKGIEQGLLSLPSRRETLLDIQGSRSWRLLQRWLGRCRWDKGTKLHITYQ